MSHRLSRDEQEHLRVDASLAWEKTDDERVEVAARHSHDKSFVMGWLVRTNTKVRAPSWDLDSRWYGARGSASAAGGAKVKQWREDRKAGRLSKEDPA